MAGAGRQHLSSRRREHTTLVYQRVPGPPHSAWGMTSGPQPRRQARRGIEAEALVDKALHHTEPLLWSATQTVWPPCPSLPSWGSLLGIFLNIHENTSIEHYSAGNMAVCTRSAWNPSCCSPVGPTSSKACI
jgi:hypothetical protein